MPTCKSVRTTWKTLSGVWVSISASGHTTNWNCSSVRFRATATALNEEYDRFLTLSDAAMCLMYKERVLHSEETPLKIYYTDRQGVPVAIDITGKEGKNKLTDNSNFFCLGPSGSGKSFHMHVIWTKTHRKELQTKLRETS